MATRYCGCPAVQLLPAAVTCQQVATLGNTSSRWKPAANAVPAVRAAHLQAARQGRLRLSPIARTGIRSWNQVKHLPARAWTERRRYLTEGAPQRDVHPAPMTWRRLQALVGPFASLKVFTRRTPWLAVLSPLFPFPTRATASTPRYRAQRCQRSASHARPGRIPRCSRPCGCTCCRCTSRRIVPASALLLSASLGHRESLLPAYILYNVQIGTFCIATGS